MKLLWKIFPFNMYIKRVTRKKTVKDANVFKIATREYNKDPSPTPTQKGYIYILSPGVSDLIIVKNNLFKRCDDEEWIWFYHNILNPKNVPEVIKKRRGKRLA